MLEIKNLPFEIASNPILNGLMLTADVGELHATTGPDGKGTSILGDAEGSR